MFSAVWRKSNIPSINVWILRRRVKQSFPESVDYRTTFRLNKLFQHSVVDLQVCLGSLSCCMTQFQLSLSWKPASHLTLWYTEFMADLITVRCSGPVPAEQAQIITLPLPCLTVGVCLCWCVQSFTPFAVFQIISNESQANNYKLSDMQHTCQRLVLWQRDSLSPLPFCKGLSPSVRSLTRLPTPLHGWQ